MSQDSAANNSLNHPPPTLHLPQMEPSSPCQHQHPQHHHQNPCNNSNISSQAPFHNLSLDCINIICQYHIFHLQNGDDWRNGRSIYIGFNPNFSPVISSLELLQYGIDDSNWDFLCRYAHCCHYYGVEGLREFLSECRHWELKPTFSYLKLQYLSSIKFYQSGAVEYLRGVPELDLTGFYSTPSESSGQPNDADVASLFQNIRGVKKLAFSFPRRERHRDLTAKHLENLRGIQEASFASCIFSSNADDSFSNLRGIRSLSLRHCTFAPANQQIFHNLRGIREFILEGPTRLTLDAREFKNLRGIRKLRVEMCGPFLSNEHLENLRGIQDLDVSESQIYSNSMHAARLSDDSFKNLRGIKKLNLHRMHVIDRVTNAAFTNLRGVEDVRLHGMPVLTSELFENFRGIKKLDIINCPGIEFEPETLYNIQGISELFWDSFSEGQNMVMKNDAVKQLQGVRILELYDVILAGDEAFQNLKEVRDLSLSVARECDSMAITAAAFSHLFNVKYLKLIRVNMEKVDSLQDLLNNCMPHLESFHIVECLIKEESVDIEFSSRYRHENPAEFFVRKKNGKWIGYCRRA